MCVCFDAFLCNSQESSLVQPQHAVRCMVVCLDKFAGIGVVCVYKILARKPDKKVRRTVHIYIYRLCAFFWNLLLSLDFVRVPLELDLYEPLFPVHGVRECAVFVARWYWTTMRRRSEPHLDFKTTNPDDYKVDAYFPMFAQHISFEWSISYEVCTAEHKIHSFGIHFFGFCSD